jgi:hypothetical protein
MGRQEGRVTHFESPRYRLQAFVSTILKQLNKPPFLPQLCSISSKLVITHTMTPRPTVIGYKVIGVGLPAFLLSKNVYSESIGMSQIDRHSDHAKSIGSGLVWRDLPVRVARTRLPALLTPASAEFLLRVLVPCDLLREIPCGTSPHSSLATNHCRKIKNPASSAGYSPGPNRDSTRCSTSF